MSSLVRRGCLARIARAATGPGLLAFLASAAGAQPALSSLAISPPAPGSGAVLVSYFLSHPAAQPCTVTLEGSPDNGATWGRLWAVTGAVGTGVTTSAVGLPKTVTWNAGHDWPAQRFPAARLRLTADDGSGSDTGSTVYLAVPAGVFTMGDPLDGIADAPLRQVNLGSYWIARTETTKAEWDTMRAWGLTHGYPDLSVAGGKAPSHPVQDTTWYDAVKWCNARSEQEGLTPAYYTTDAQTIPYRTGTLDLAPTQVRWSATGYRLPTEAEWERAARGGVAGRRFPLGDTISHEQANYASSASYAYDVSPTRGHHPAHASGAEPYTAPVGSFPPNGYGLVDMTGNVWEFCWDWFGPIAAAPATDPRGPPPVPPGWPAAVAGSASPWVCATPSGAPAPPASPPTTPDSARCGDWRRGSVRAPWRAEPSSST